MVWSPIEVKFKPVYSHYYVDGLLEEIQQLKDYNSVLMDKISNLKGEEV